jgi:hypothetical protein
MRRPYRISTIARKVRILNEDRLHAILKGKLLPNEHEAARLCAFFGLRPGSIKHNPLKRGRPPKALPRKRVA